MNKNSKSWIIRNPFAELPPVYQISHTIIKVDQLEQFILKNEKNMKSYEISWCRELIRYLAKSGAFEKKSFDSIEFFEELKAKRKVSHKKQALWYSKIFGSIGANYI
jgi:hypothetical protein